MWDVTNDGPIDFKKEAKPTWGAKV